MQRKVAYVFLYKNGIRERSVGIVRRYGTAEQPEVALELFGEEVRKKRWTIYYFTKGEALAEAAHLWGNTTERGKSEVPLTQCRLCAEAGMGAGLVLLPEEAQDGVLQGNCGEVPHGEVQDGNGFPERSGERQKARTDFREYLCARYDGREVTEEELQTAFCRKPETEEDPRIASAKRLMEEITKAAGGVIANETDASAEGEVLSEAGGGEDGERSRKQDADRRGREKKRAGRQMPHLEKLLFSNPPYVPCRRYEVEYSVRVSPEELSELSTEGKRFGENSFVLHGYYFYRHVLLGRRTGKKKEEYVLLVPGNYSEKQAGLAQRFGFPEFFPVAKTPETDSAASGTGLFGYYCGKI